MDGPSTPVRDRFGGSQRSSSSNFGSLPPLTSFSGTVDEQIQQAKEWREKSQSQTSNPAIRSNQYASQSLSPATARSTFERAPSASTTPQRPPWRSPSSQYTPPRGASRYTPRHNQQSQGQWHHSPPRYAPYHHPQSSPASNAPYDPHYQSVHYDSNPSVSASCASGFAVPWQPSSAHPTAAHHHQAQSCASPSGARDPYRYGNQSSSHNYREPLPSSSIHPPQASEVLLHSHYGAQQYQIQPPAPAHFRQHGYQYPTAGLDHSRQHGSQGQDDKYHRQNYSDTTSRLGTHGYNQRGFQAQALHAQDQQHGHRAQAAAPGHPRQFGAYGHQPQAAHSHLGGFNQLNATYSQTPIDSSIASQRQGFESHSLPKTTVPSTSVEDTDLVAFAASDQGKDVSEDEDWKAFEAEVIYKAPTAASAAAIARNFKDISIFDSGIFLPAKCKPTVHLSDQDSSAELRAGVTPDQTTPKQAHALPNHPHSVGKSVGDAVRRVSSTSPVSSPVESSSVKINSNDAVSSVEPEAVLDLPVEPGVETCAGVSVQVDPITSITEQFVSAQLACDKAASQEPAAEQPSTTQSPEPELRPRGKNWSKRLAKNLAIKPSIEGFRLGSICGASGAPASDSNTIAQAQTMNQDKGKRKASEEPESPTAAKRVKHADSTAPEPEPKPKPAVIPFPEKPAVIEERNGEIEFHVVNNDGSHNSFIILTHLKCIFQKQLPKMPKDYIARLVYDRTHLSIAIVKHPLEVVGGITFRPFRDRKFAEIVFCAISSDQQVKGYGAHLMAHLKDYVQSSSPVMHFLTYADNYAIGYFKKQGFTKEITLEKSVWMGYIKDYEGGTIMQCTMLPRVRYLETGRMLLKQRETVEAKIRATSSSHIVYQPPKQWRNGVVPIDPMSIPAIRNAGWSPEMDELARQPRRGANYNQLLHLLNSMQNNQSAWPFLAPVNRDEVQDYYEVIKEPMDLSTMEQKLEADKYPNPEDFLKDAMLIFKNCRQYNSEGTPYTKMANKLEKFVWTKVREIPEWSHLEEELATKK